MSDLLSRVHYKAVRSEIEGRFFSSDEAVMLKSAIDERTIEDQRLREMAAKSWEGNEISSE